MRRIPEIIAIVLMACGRGTPTPSTPAPVDAPEPAAARPVAAAPAAFTFAYRAGAFRIHFRTVATSAVSESGAISGVAVIPTDSQSVSSDLFLSVAASDLNGDLRLAGTIDSQRVDPPRVRGAGSGLSRLLLPLAFSGVVGHNGQLELTVARDSSRAGCWSEARTVLDPLHAVFPFVATPLAEGARWSDSTETTTCRLGIPVRVREVRAFVLDSVRGAPENRVGHASYSSFTTTAGTRAERSGMVSLSGTGSGSGVVTLDPHTGMLRRDEADLTYTLSLRVEGRTRTLEQRARRTIDVLPRD